MTRVRLSNHALLRYLERAWGVDVERARAEILTPQVIEAIEAGATAISMGTFTLVAEHGRIVTVLGEGMRASRKMRRATATVPAPGSPA